MGIRRTLNRSLFLPIFSLVLVAAIIVSIVTYATANAQLEQRVQDLAESSAVLFEDLLWQLDYEALQFLLDEYVALGVVTSASITAGAHPDISAGGDSSPSSSYSYTRTLFRAQSNQTRPIGTLTLVMSRQSVWSLVRTRLTATLLIATLAVLATTFIIQRLLSQRLVAPVLTIANGLDSWHGDWQDFEIDLRRNRTGGYHSEDELDRLVNSIHRMRDQILNANSIIKSKDASLLSAAKIAGIGYASFELETGRFVECDEHFAGMIGLTVEEMLGFTIRDDIIGERMHVDDTDQAIKIGKQLARGIPAESILRIANQTGEYRYIRQLYNVSAAENGVTHLVHTVAQDVTELNRLQNTLVQAQKVKTIGNLTGGVAHDFNNILAVISGNLELLDARISDSSAHKYVQTSLRAVQIGAELTHQLLAFARKQPLRPEVLDLSRLIRDLRTLLRSTVGEDIDLEVVVDGGLWRAEVDRAQLESSIINLVINARDSMPEGGKLTIEVGNARLDRSYADLHDEVNPGQYVCIAVTDTGAGMGISTISQALEPFFTTKDVGSGTGLGLPMVHGFVKQSGGHLKIYSELNRGTTVKLYLPRAYSPMDSQGPDVIHVTATQFNGLHVFLVEDNSDLRETFTKQLEEMGFIVHCAADGEKALSMARDVPHVDFILCDVVLPHGMNGPEAVQRLQGCYPDSAVIYMSGYTENAIIHQGKLDQGVTLLQKPFSRNDLIVAFAQTLSGAG